MLVFRIEHPKTRKGPYRHGCGYIRAGNHRPTPDVDDLPYPWDVLDHKYGFASLGQLREWFDHDDELDRFEDRGLHISVLRVSDKTTKHGGRQVVFKARGARRLASIRIRDVRDALPGIPNHDPDAGLRRLANAIGG